MIIKLQREESISTWGEVKCEMVLEEHTGFNQTEIA